MNGFRDIFEKVHFGPILGPNPQIPYTFHEKSWKTIYFFTPNTLENHTIFLKYPGKVCQSLCGHPAGKPGKPGKRPILRKYPGKPGK